MSRTPFIVTVVGALLIGGATTGTTRASWVAQRSTSASTVSSGTMTSAISSSPTTLAKLPPDGVSFATSTFTVSDTGTGRNLVQRLEAAVSRLPQGVDAYVSQGSTCSTGGGTSASIDKRPTDSSHTTTFCVRAVAGTTAVAGDIEVAVSGRQHPGGWSGVSTTLRIPVTIGGLRCTAGQNKIVLSWDAVSGASSYSVAYGSSATGPFSNAVYTNGTATTVDSGFVGNTTRYYRMTTNSGHVSNVLSVTRTNSGIYTGCAS